MTYPLGEIQAEAIAQTLIDAGLCVDEVKVCEEFVGRVYDRMRVSASSTGEAVAVVEMENELAAMRNPAAIPAQGEGVQHGNH